MATASHEQDVLPGGYVLAYLPAIGSVRRNPSFWSDIEVRRLVVAHHRQMTVDEARDVIRAAVGDERTPSRSALARAWKRLDKAISTSRVRLARRAQA
jgi:plasmid stability protein